MKLDKAINTLQEEWADSKLVNKITYDIFVNPSKNELREISNKDDSFRFLADNKTKKFYVFNVELLHSTAAYLLKLNGYWSHKPEDFIVGGVAYKDSFSSFNNLSMLNKEEIKKVYALDWSWTDRWVKLDKYLKNKKLMEEWADSIKPHKKTYEIFVNPSRKEMLEVVNKDVDMAFRFIADSRTKKLYVFNYNLMHVDVCEKLGMLTIYKSQTKPDIVAGEGKLNPTGTNAHMTNSFNLDMLTPKGVNYLHSKDWSWANKWIINISSYVEDTK
ncbi:MAG TPA: hypothetical protein VMZ91_11265 [Candidatus Paceibacterota bacterium]|nr:hypothetical protein [Candidatus Paceibacterota bacterium]